MPFIFSSSLWKFSLIRLLSLLVLQPIPSCSDLRMIDPLSFRFNQKRNTFICGFKSPDLHTGSSCKRYCQFQFFSRTGKNRFFQEILPALSASRYHQKVQNQSFYAFLPVQRSPVKNVSMPVAGKNQKRLVFLKFREFSFKIVK